MSKSYRMLGSAFAGLILIGAAPIEKPKISQNTPKNVNTPAASSSNYTAYPDKNADECYKTENHESADLCAQWRAAVATEKSANLSLWGNWIGGIGGFLSFVSIVLVLIALRQTEKSLTIAQKDRATATRRALTSAAETETALSIAARNADATTELAKVMKDSASHQLRAYVLIDSGYFVLSPAKEPIVTLRIKNFGQTPAASVRSWIHTWIAEFPLESELPYPSDGEIQMGAADIAQGNYTEFSHNGAVLNEYSYEEIAGGRAAIYLYGEVTYKDIYGGDRVYAYQLFCAGKDAFDRGRFAPYMSGNVTT